MIKLKKKKAEEPEAVTEVLEEEDLGEQLSIDLPEPAEPEAGEDPDKPADKVRKPSKLRLPGSVGKGVPVWVTALLGVLVLALGAGVFLLSRAADGRLSQNDVNDAVRTAGLTAQHVTSFDYRTLDADTKQVLGESTGKFRADYAANAKRLLSTAPTQEAVAQGQASKYGVESVHGGTVKVLVFLNQTTALKGKDKKIELRQLRLTMVRGDGEQSDQWLLSRLEVL